MDWTIDYLKEADVLAVATSGTMTLESLCAMVAESVQEARRLGTRKVLVDHRRTVSALTTLDIYHAPEREREAGAATSTWVAVVRPRTSAAPDDGAFYENIATNAGMARRVFDDRDSALAWLAACPTEAR